MARGHGAIRQRLHSAHVQVPAWRCPMAHPAQGGADSAGNDFAAVIWAARSAGRRSTVRPGG